MMLLSQLFVHPVYPAQSFHGQTVIVTGSNAGLGIEAARHFARLGAAKVILAVRNRNAGYKAQVDIEQTTGCYTGILEVWTIDLTSYKSVQAFAQRAIKLERIDVLCENAGIATNTKRLVEGHESTMTVNIISTFLLALLLLPKLQETAKKFEKEATLTIVASEAHRWCRFPEWKEASVFEALDKSEDMSERYCISKLLQILVVRQLALQLHSSSVVLNVLNPGLCDSKLARDCVGSIILFLLGRTCEVGSRILVAAAMAGRQSHGKYISNGEISEQQLSPFIQSQDGEAAGQKIWKELSGILEEITPGVTQNLGM